MGLFDIFKKKEKANTVNNCCEHKENTIECLFDIQTMDIEPRQQVEQLLQRQSEWLTNDIKMYLLFANQFSERKVYCIIAEIKNDNIYIYISQLENDIIRNNIGDSFESEEFYGYDKNEFFGKLFNLKQEIHLDAKKQAYIWSAMMKIFPEYTPKTTLRKPIYEKYFPYSFNDLVGADEYINSGILYRVVTPLKKKHQDWTEFQTWKVRNWNQENQEYNLLSCTLSKLSNDYTMEKFLSDYSNPPERDINDALSSIPHRTIYIDNQASKICGAMYFSDSYRELHIYQSKSDKSIVVLKIYSVFNSHPREGGRMEGYTFSQTIEIPSEQYAWTDEKLIAEYAQHFPK